MSGDQPASSEVQMGLQLKHHQQNDAGAGTARFWVHSKAAKRRRVGHADGGALVAAPTKVEEVPWTSNPAIVM